MLLHGENIEASRNELNRIKTDARDKEIRIIDGRNIDATNLSQAVSSQSLLGAPLIVIIENLFSRRKKGDTLLKQLLPILVSASHDAEIVCWEEKTIESTKMTELGRNSSVRLFEFPKIIFQLLDGFRPNNAKSLLILYRQVIQNTAPEQVFRMMTTRMRHLLMLSGGIIPERLQGWQATRLTTQAKLFSIERLRTMYKTLLDIEYSIKSGNTPFTMQQLTEQFFIHL